MDTKELIHTAALIASGLVPRNEVTLINDGVMDSIAKTAVALALKIETLSRDAYKIGAHKFS